MVAAITMRIARGHPVQPMTYKYVSGAIEQVGYWKNIFKICKCGYISHMQWCCVHHKVWQQGKQVKFSGVDINALEVDGSDKHATFQKLTTAPINKIPIMRKH